MNFQKQSLKTIEGAMILKNRSEMDSINALFVIQLSIVPKSFSFVQKGELNEKSK